MVDTKILHCKLSFGIVKMFIKTPQNLDLYLAVDKKYMKTIDANYSVRVGYWALRNNVQEYKVCNRDTDICSTWFL
jgi:hypothetical protein